MDALYLWSTLSRERNGTLPVFQIRNSLRRELAPIFCLAMLPFVSNAEPEETLKVITYNVQFLPSLASFKNQRGEPAYRAKRIAEEIRAYDIVGLQETFHEKYRALLLEALGEYWKDGFQTMISPKDPKRAINGGCLIATQRPIIETNSTIFKHYSRPLDYGFRADGFAAKGVIHARIARSKKERDNTIDVFVTHLEARADDLRHKQYEEISEFIRQISDASTPCLIMGDFNTGGNLYARREPASAFHLLLNALQESRPDQEVLDLWPTLMGEMHGGTTEQNPQNGGKRIDYCFLSNPKPPHTRLRPVAIRVEVFLDERVEALSDHNAVTATFLWPASSESTER